MPPSLLRELVSTLPTRQPNQRLMVSVCAKGRILMLCTAFDLRFSCAAEFVLHLRRRDSDVMNSRHFGKQAHEDKLWPPHMPLSEKNVSPSKSFRAHRKSHRVQVCAQRMGLLISARLARITDGNAVFWVSPRVAPCVETCIETSGNRKCQPGFQCS